MKSDLESRYRQMADEGKLDDLLAIFHSHSYRPDAQELARSLLLDKGLSEDDINQWRDPNAELAGMPLFRDSRAPFRVLLLRPFALFQSGKRTRRFVQEYLRPKGHVYTLADSEIRPRREPSEVRQALLASLSLALPFLSRLLRNSFYIHYDEDIPRLMHFIGRRICRNVALTLSIDGMCKIICPGTQPMSSPSSTYSSVDKLRKIVCREPWRHTVRYLINSFNIVVVDLSDTGSPDRRDGLKWEVDELRFYGVMSKVVFVALNASASRAHLFLESCGLSRWDKELFLYSEEGLALRPERLSAALASAAARSVRFNNLLEPTAK